MKTLTFGGWYQRTTLHLTELYNFLSEGKSNLDLSQKKLDKHQKNLDSKSVKRKSDYLEYIEIETKEKIQIRYYEDGLYVFEIQSNDVEKDSKKLKDYFDTKWKPAVDYIFSLGAPTPKILSNMKDDHPIVIGGISTSPRTIKIDEKEFGKIYSETSSRNIRVFKTRKYIVTIVSKSKKKELAPLIDMQIFFREFKLQLHKYLDIHRKVWEEIAEIKEKKQIKGKDIGKYKSELESLDKTINLIGNRINQMGAYAKTRASLAKQIGIEEDLKKHFEYKHEDLFNTLEYIKEIWKMTQNYVNSAIQVMRDLSNTATSKGIKSIQLLASIGVITGLVRYANVSTLQKVDFWGIVYIVSLGAIAFGLDSILKWSSRNKEYQLKFAETTKDI